MANRGKNSILCHNSQIKYLEDVINGGKIPHAFLFSGPRGIGKAEVAKQFAKMILIIGAPVIEDKDESTEIDLFGDIQPEKPEKKSSVINPAISEKVDNGTHLDLFYLKLNEEEEEKNIGIDQVRELGRSLSLSPAEGVYRVALIDSIDDFNNNSANAILKILEEPSKNTVLIILCHSRAGLLPTIRSRCQEIIFKPLTKNEFSEVISKTGDDNIDELYELSEGSPGMAMEIIDKKVNESLNKYLNIITKKIVKISDITALSKEIKDRDSWDIFGKLLLKRYSAKIKKINKNSIKKDIDTYSELSKIIYFSSLRNMDVQDSLKLITYQINNK